MSEISFHQKLTIKIQTFFAYLKITLYKNHFPYNKSFLQLPIVRLSIAVIALAAASLSAAIVMHSDLAQDWSYMGLNKFVEIFQVPLGTLTLLIPILAIFTANHRSEQTKESIRLTQEQNIFSNHYKHIEEFAKYVQKINEDDAYIFEVEGRSFHKKCFPNSKTGDFKFNKGKIESAKTHANHLLALKSKLLHKIGSTGPNALENVLHYFNDGIMQNNLSYISRKKKTNDDPLSKDAEFKNLMAKPPEIISGYINYYEMAQKLFSFEENNRNCFYAQIRELKMLRHEIQLLYPERKP